MAGQTGINLPIVSHRERRPVSIHLRQTRENADVDSDRVGRDKVWQGKTQHKYEKCDSCLQFDLAGMRQPSGPGWGPPGWLVGLHSVCGLCSLEVELQSQLPDSRIVGTLDAAKPRTADGGAWILKIRAVEDIEELRPELQFETLR
jgi:hypothetical protein